MKYYCAVLTHGITRTLDFMLLTVAVALGLFGLDAWVILPESHAPLVEVIRHPGCIVACGIDPWPDTAPVSHQTNRRS